MRVFMRVIFVTGCFLFIASMLVPAATFEKFECPRHCEPNEPELCDNYENQGEPVIRNTFDRQGYELFVAGLFYTFLLGIIFFHPGAYGWFANFFLFVSLVCTVPESRSWRKLSKFFILAACILSVMSLKILNHFLLLEDEGGVMCSRVSHPLPGFWLWTAAIFLFALYVFLRTEKRIT